MTQLLYSGTSDFTLHYGEERGKPVDGNPVIKTEAKKYTLTAPQVNRQSGRFEPASWVEIDPAVWAAIKADKTCSGIVDHLLETRQLVVA